MRESPIESTVDRLRNDRCDLGPELQIKHVAIAIGTRLTGFERIVHNIANSVDTLSWKIDTEDLDVVEVVCQGLGESRNDNAPIGCIGKVKVLRCYDDIGRYAACTENTIATGSSEPNAVSKSRLTYVIATCEAEDEFAR